MCKGSVCDSTLCSSTPSTSRRWFAIRHDASGRLDGWYSDRETAEGVLAYFREEFPAYSFTFVERGQGEGFLLHGNNVLKADWLRQRDGLQVAQRPLEKPSAAAPSTPRRFRLITAAQLLSEHGLRSSAIPAPGAPSPGHGAGGADGAQPC